MKWVWRYRQRIFAAIAAIVVVFVISPKQTFSQNSPNTTEVSVSDAVYADLALRHGLDNVSLYWVNEKRKGETATVNANKQWLPASTVKAFVAMYAYDLAAKKKLDLTKYVTIEAKNSVSTEIETDEFPPLEEGVTASIGTLIREMITQSDNTAYNTLLDILDRREVTAYAQKMGLTHTIVGSKLNLDDSQTQYEYDVPGFTINTTTAEDFAKAFVLIDQGKIPGSRDMYETLKGQKINNMIPAFLPQTITVAHKTGELDPLYHDGGIIKGKNLSYILTVFTNLGDPGIIAHLARLIYTRNYDLIGAKIVLPQENLPQSQKISDGLTTLATDSQVLATETPITVKTPDITAADLGITAKDLSPEQGKQLPKVIIPADSPFHAVIPTIFGFRKLATLVSPTRSIQTDMDYAALQIAEAKDLKARKKTVDGAAALANAAAVLKKSASDPAVQQNPSLQVQIRSLSNTRFDLLSDQLSKAPKAQRVQLIKDIANQARDTVNNIQPYIKTTTNAASPNQKPLIGQVVSTTDSSMTVKTAGGQQVTVPLPNTVKVRSVQNAPAVPTFAPTAPFETVTETPTVTAIQPQTIKPGTTIALVGASDGTTIVPTFILTNVPKEIAAPRPVLIVNINQKDKTMTVSENGVNLKVDVTQQTIIKGKDTNVSVQSVKAGDVVVVHGEPQPQQTIAPQTNTQPASSTPNASAPGLTNTTGKVVPLSGQRTSVPVTIVPSVGPTSANLKPQGSEKTTFQTSSGSTIAPQQSSQTTQKAPKAPAVNNPPQAQSKPAAPAAPALQPKKEEPKKQEAPKVIKATTIRVIENKK